jgi:16S rRNA (guanine966-N2)-methyltransferase
MRIIAGSLKRRTITVPRGLDVRPTSDRTREAIFSLVEARLELEDAVVLDLFSGSGALGFEALSRGARSAEFVERDRRAARGIRDAAERLEVDADATVIQADAVAFLRRYSGEPYDCIFADPPYGMEGVAALPGLALPHVVKGGLFVLEHDRSFRFEDEPGLLTTRSYGRSTVSLFAPE